MNALSTLPSLEKIIEIYGLLARKSLGQHFLLDGALTDEIVRYAGDLSGYNVIEIGPGPGGLTRSLLKAGAKKLFVVEKDDRCIAALAALKDVVGEQLEIIHGDALHVNLLAQVPGPRKIVANLPYNAGTAMLLQWLDGVYSPSPAQRGRAGEGVLLQEQSVEYAAPAPFPLRQAASWDAALTLPRKRDRGYESLTLMFQKEVAERITASPGTKDFGRLSVLCQWLCECRYDFELPPEAFTPPPKVTSAVVTLVPREKPLVDVSKAALELIVAKAFGQRRKMLRSSLKGLAVPADSLLQAAGIDGSLRAEQLDVVTLCQLGKIYQDLTS